MRDNGETIELEGLVDRIKGYIFAPACVKKLQFKAFLNWNALVGPGVGKSAVKSRSLYSWKTWYYLYCTMVLLCCTICTAILWPISHSTKMAKQCSKFIQIPRYFLLLTIGEIPGWLAPFWPSPPQLGAKLNRRSNAKGTPQSFTINKKY